MKIKDVGELKALAVLEGIVREGRLNRPFSELMGGFVLGDYCDQEAGVAVGDGKGPDVVGGDDGWGVGYPAPSSGMTYSASSCRCG